MRHQLKALKTAFIEPIQYRSAPLLLQRVEQLIHQHTGGRFHYPVRKFIRPLRPKVRLPTSDFIKNDEAVTSEIRKHGYCILPQKLDPTIVAEFHRYIYSAPCYASLQPDHPVVLSPTEARTDDSHFSFPLNTLLYLTA